MTLYISSDTQSTTNHCVVYNSMYGGERGGRFVFGGFTGLVAGPFTALAILNINKLNNRQAPCNFPAAGDGVPVGSPRTAFRRGCALTTVHRACILVLRSP